MSSKLSSSIGIGHHLDEHDEEGTACLVCLRVEGNPCLVCHHDEENQTCCLCSYWMVLVPVKITRQNITFVRKPERSNANKKYPPQGTHPKYCGIRVDVVMVMIAIVWKTVVSMVTIRIVVVMFVVRGVITRCIAVPMVARIRMISVVMLGRVAGIRRVSIVIATILN